MLGVGLSDTEQAARKDPLLPSAPSRFCAAGRLLQLVKQGKLCLDGVRLLVLDEADQLLGESFQEGLRELWARLPERFQTVATSATYPPKVARTLEQELLNKPVIVRLEDGTPALLGVSQWYCVADRTDEVAWFPRKLCALENILRRQPFSQCLVFLNSQARAQSLADRLSHAGFPAQLLSGAQDQEQRLKALVQLKAFRCRILVSTDLVRTLALACMGHAQLGSLHTQ
ncbi:hypothetical protein V5799_014610 [Amblyomma americanum]|uniref:Helicase ATP-binding domain-containing protein n=1 Tax=Amblyomma americanum TaxID=6943 RepID=A0AAQ4E2I5_AMBAM